MAVDAVAHEAGGKGLKTGALGLVAVVVIGVASTAPGYSLAASLGGVSGAVGLKAPAIMWMAFIPMGCIAAAYFYLNKADPDCGTTFTWVTRAMGPKTGWFGGWGIVLADLVIMPNLAGISGQYVFLLFGKKALAADVVWTTALGCVFIMAMSWICVVGIELSARTQVGLLGTEVVVLVLFSIISMYKVFSDHPKGSVTPTLSWLVPTGFNSSAMAAGLVLAVFIYWGWDTAVSVNEECEDSSRTPGIAAVVSTVLLLLIYVVVTFGAQAYAGSDFLANSTDVLNDVGALVFGGGFFGTLMQKLLIISVLTSAAASCQTTILPAARSALSMGVHGAAPKKLAEMDRRHLTPGFATWLFGVIACLWYVGLQLITSQTDTNAYGASIAAVGIMIAFYYGLTGYACIVYYWKHIFTSAKNFVFVGLLPLIGSGVLTWVLVKTLRDSYDTAYQSLGGLFGVGTVFVIGVGLLILGIPLMLVWRARAPRFFTFRRDPVGLRPDPDGNGGPAPVLGEIVKAGSNVR